MRALRIFLLAVLLPFIIIVVLMISPVLILSWLFFGGKRYYL